jgi:hypothetical protein
MSGHSPSHGSDKGAAFAGLIGGAVLIGAILLAITLWTNTQFAGHKAGEKAATTTAH